MRDPGFGRRVVPIIPDEARTFGMDPLFREVGIYASQGQRYEPVDSDLVLSYREARDGQVLEEGINEAGSMASFQAAGTSYATHGEPMIPFYIFYSMFGFQRTGDQAWAFADARGRGFMMGATAGRTTLNGEGLQHEDGHSHLLASTVPAIRAYDPAFAYELAVIVRDGIERMYGRGEDHLYYVTLYNENHPMPPKPERRGRGDHPGHLPVPGGAGDRRAGRGRASGSSVRARSSSRRSRRASSSPSASAWPPRCTARPRGSSSGATPSRRSAGTASTRPTRRGCPSSARCSAPTAGLSSSSRTGSRRFPTCSGAGSRRATSPSARRASAGATRARRCAGSSRSTRPNVAVAALAALAARGHGPGEPGRRGDRGASGSIPTSSTRSTCRGGRGTGAPAVASRGQIDSDRPDRQVPEPRPRAIAHRPPARRNHQGAAAMSTPRTLTSRRLAPRLGRHRHGRRPRAGRRPGPGPRAARRPAARTAPSPTARSAWPAPAR